MKRLIYIVEQENDDGGSIVGCFVSHETALLCASNYMATKLGYENWVKVDETHWQCDDGWVSVTQYEVKD